MRQAAAQMSSGTDAASGDGQPSHLLRYIGEMLDELYDLVPTNAGPLLPYLIDIARTEAEERYAAAVGES